MKHSVVLKQIHSNVIHDIKPPLPGLFSLQGDGLITTHKYVELIAYGADCAMITFEDSRTIGICHAGWRGLHNGVIENMRKCFHSSAKCHISPFLHHFEIQRDECYQKLREKYGGIYFYLSDKGIMFDFKQAILDAIYPLRYTIDNRSTYDYPQLGSWRRDQRKDKGSQNRLVIWRDTDCIVRKKLYLPHEEIPMG